MPEPSDAESMSEPLRPEPTLAPCGPGVPPLPVLVEHLRAAPSWQRKHELGLVASGILPLPEDVGDDCAAIADGDGFLLLAAEVMWPPMVERAPELAGVNAVLANVNDVYAMGGRPVAILDTLLARDLAGAEAVLRGIARAARRYGIPVAGGHLTASGETTSLSAFIVGRARKLLSGRSAEPGDELLLLTGGHGRFVGAFPFWECSADRSDEELRGDLDLLPRLAEAGLCDAARDVSMPGVLGSALQFLEGSGVGACIDVERLPFPPEARGGSELRWLLSFPSYGFLLAVGADATGSVQALARERGRVCARIGRVTEDRRVMLRWCGDEALLWDLAGEPFAGFGSR